MIELGLQNGSTQSVTFVMVNWNQRQLTLESLDSLSKLNCQNFSIVLVDNGSEDDSVDAVRDAFPKVTVLKNETNLGIAAANNVGIKYALKADSDYIFLINNDTTVNPEMLTHLIKVAESDPSIGIVGPTMLYFDQPDIIWCAGNHIDWDSGRSVLLREGSPVSSIENVSCQDVDFITSCAACIKRDVFENVGVMDERYFIYYDETDWFSRASTAGWRTVYVPWAKMWHKVSATMGESSPRTDYYMVRNRFLFLSKNLTGLKRVISLTRAGLQNMRAIAAYTVKSYGGDRLHNRNGKFFGMRDAILGHWGEMSPDVQSRIYND